MGSENTLSGSSRAVAFSIANTHFAIDVSNVLSFTDEFQQVQKVRGGEDHGFVGYIECRDALVHVFDAAVVLNRKPVRDKHNELISTIDSYKQAHVDWLNALEASVRKDVSFDKPRDPSKCAFGKWYYSFETDDQELRAMLDKIEAPHNRIHQLADKLLEMRDKGQVEEAIAELNKEKRSSLKTLMQILDMIQEMLIRNVHPVVMHLTRDGVSPWFSMVLDEIDDIVDYEVSQLDTSVAGSLGRDPIRGYLRHNSGKRYMMVCLDQFFEQANAWVPHDAAPNHQMAAAHSP